MNKRKILEAAQKHLQKGSLDKALKEYTTLLQADPRDANARLKVGDIQLRRGNRDEAITAYLKVAEQFMQDGFDAKAVAIYKQIAKIDPKRYDVYVPLADLYQRLGLTAEAMSALQTAADACNREGKQKEALELLRRTATLDPTNTTSRLKIAELLAQADLVGDAVAEYEEIAAELARQGDPERAVTTYQRALEIAPEQVSTLVALALVQLEHDAAADAERHVKRALELDAACAPAHEALVAIYRRTNQTDALREQERKLAELYADRGDQDRAKDIYQRLPPEALGALDPGDGSAPGETASGDGLGFEPEQLVAEARVYLKFGKHDRAVQTLETALEHEPDHLGALEALGEAWLEQGASDRARDAWSRGVLVARERGDDAEREALEKRLAELPAAEGVAEGADADAGGPEGVADAAAPDTGASDTADDVASGDAGDEPVLDPDGGPEIEFEIELDGAVEGGTEPAPQAESASDAAEDVEIELAFDGELTEEEPAAAESPGAEAEPASEDVAAPDLEVAIDTLEAAKETPLAAAGEASATDEADVDAPSFGELDLAEELEAEAEAEAETASQAPHAAAERETAAHEVEVEAAPLEAPSFGEVEIDLTPESEFEPASDAGPEPSFEPEHTEAGTAAEAEPFETTLDEGEPVPIAADDAAATHGAEALAVTLDASSSTTPQQITEDLEEAEFYFAQQLHEEAEAIFRRVLEVAPSHPQALLRLGEIAQLRGEVPDVGGAPEQMSEPAVEGAASSLVEVSAESAAEDGTRDFVDENLDDLDDLDAPELDLGLDDAAGPADATPSTREAPAVEEGGFDLAAELAEELEADTGGASPRAPQPALEGLESIFHEFKQGVSQSLDEGDTETRYDLGIAYKEMGLLEDAMGEFELASRSTSRRRDALQMLGACALELGRPGDAVAHLQQALSDAGIPREQELALRFELGMAFEAADARTRAHEAFAAVAAASPGFRDVDERLARLADAAPDPTDAGGAGDADAAGPGEVFESFDDVIAEARAGLGEAAPAPRDAEQRKPPSDAGSDARSDPGAKPPAGKRRHRKISFG